jgi:hypothetical protein
MVDKTLVIYRTYFNFIANGADGKTPATRIGLARGNIRLEDVLFAGNPALQNLECRRLMKKRKAPISPSMIGCSCKADGDCM